MSAVYHTPLAVSAALNSLAFNAVFGDLDAAIVGLDTRIDTLEEVRVGTAPQTRLNIGDGSIKTLADNAFSPSASFHYVDTEDAVAADYLDTINGGTDGDTLWLVLANAARVVTIRNVDNIQVKPTGSYTMDVNDPLPGFFEDGKWTFRGSTAVPAMAILEHQEATTVDGGTFTQNAWQTRDINTRVSDAWLLASVHKLAFTVGRREIVAGDEIVGDTSTETAQVFDVEVTSGSWDTDDAAGNLWIYDQSGAFVAEDIYVDDAYCVEIAADSTTGEIRLLAGTYRVEASAVAFDCDNHQARWRNTTDSETVAVGNNVQAASGGNETNLSHLAGRFTITTSTTFELQHRCQLTKLTTGYGRANSFGEVEVYARVQLIKEA